MSFDPIENRIGIEAMPVEILEEIRSLRDRVATLEAQVKSLKLWTGTIWD